MTADAEQTPQQAYYARVSALRARGAVDELERFTAAGPPAPMAADGWRGRVLWHVFHPPSTPELAALLTHMRGLGLIGAVQARKLTDRPATQAISVLRLLMAARDYPRALMEQNGPVFAGAGKEQIR